MIETWKVRHMLKGALTWVPILNVLRLRYASTGGSDSARYCYSVWLRHLIMLNRYGFRVKGAHIGELGPGDSLGIGLAALLSGASRYVGLDIMPFAAKADLGKIFDELRQMYSHKEPIPDNTEFPEVRPKLEAYGFPDQLIDWREFNLRGEMISSEVRATVDNGKLLDYRAPWTSPDDVAVASLDLVFSQAVLEHVDALEEAYRAMFAWLKPGGYASHVIGFVSHHLSPYWNGHWAYSDWEWQLVRGRREYLLNREPLSTHLVHVKNVGFEVLLIKPEYDESGLESSELSQRFQGLDPEDIRTLGATLILRKPYNISSPIAALTRSRFFPTRESSNS